jgi:branched-chain amino acid transport system ATP-binding protein
MLSLCNIQTYYGAVNVLKNVSLEINDGDAVTIIGANGAGKSTLLSTISGLVPVRRGRILFLEQDITSLPPHRRVDMGIIQVPEGRMIFTPFSVRENLELGMYRRFAREKKEDIEELFATAYTLFPILHERRKQNAGTLSGGEQQMLAIARALMGKPKLLLLDEPSLGLAPQLVDVVFDALSKLKEQGLTILLVEQNTQLALEFAERGYVMELGEVALEDTTGNLRSNSRVKEIYLGTG